MHIIGKGRPLFLQPTNTFLILSSYELSFVYRRSLAGVEELQPLFLPIHKQVISKLYSAYIQFLFSGPG